MTAKRDTSSCVSGVLRMIKTTRSKPLDRLRIGTHGLAGARRCLAWPRMRGVATPKHIRKWVILLTDLTIVFSSFFILKLTFQVLEYKGIKSRTKIDLSSNKYIIQKHSYRVNGDGSFDGHAKTTKLTLVQQYCY